MLLRASLIKSARQFSSFRPRYSVGTISHRKQWNSIKTGKLEEVARDLKQTQNVLVMIGAGVSTASGIPDFRTPGSGIYDNLQKYDLPYPEAIFDINYFRGKPEPFLAWAKEFFPGVNYKPNTVHYFIRMLLEKNRLLRLYTQNIDGLEAMAGIPEEKIVAAHGTFTQAACVSCGESAPISEIKEHIMSGTVPRCAACTGLVKPTIVFFGENLPERFFLYQEDACVCDYLICMGTSLEVYPFAGIADFVPKGIPRLLINKTAVGSFGSRDNDSLFLGDLEETVAALVESLEWKESLRQLCESG